MPSIANVVARFTKQTLVYWEETGSDNFGKPIYADPVEIKCRWEDTTKELLTADGRKVIARVYLLLVAEAKVGSLVMLGSLDDWNALFTVTAVPTMNQGAREVLVSNSTPDIKAHGFVFEAYL